MADNPADRARPSAAARSVLVGAAEIEHVFRARRAFIRQREVGRDTPSFEQGLLDALREDPDVLMVGEMREPPLGLEAIPHPALAA